MAQTKADPGIAGDDDHHGHKHAPGDVAMSHDVKARGRRLGEKLFLASALDRFAVALVIVGAIWLAVFWAMG